MKSLKPKFLLIGEAPGYKGCRLTGVAFTSEKVLFENAFFKNELLHFINDLDNLESKNSRTIVGGGNFKIKRQIFDLEYLSISSQRWD